MLEWLQRGVNEAQNIDDARKRSRLARRKRLRRKATS
jgi:hypothetical protein